uniref:Uncharacterized protein n=1 Tax=Candidatus Kentrum sp. FM TaxID=2126340 RepID=A0A450S299_9GAMM|nr:MAG: hypothetical protein BECKFM1743A_GA0114220_1002910 [Candidatus Kentron sp. FM]VFJ45966.1 MAG: hypothetical protein BECKFM1743C_GA0114222_1003210 [Candidatus Kentron sp. FM]VFK07411.1 MAG: hypothetical protein BECKFM1743B_GA0114221_1004010 [Candidatus Kentron sp. FM]
MNPTLIVFGIQSVIKLGRVSHSALEQWSRDKEVLFPVVNRASTSTFSETRAYFRRSENAPLVAEGGPYSVYWHQGNNLPINTPATLDALFTVMLKREAENHENPTNSAIPGAFLVGQWNSTDGPISPIARVILSAADIALDYAAINPSIFGVDGNGEKLLGAYAKNLSILIPDDGNFGVRDRFAERLAGVFLRAGLQTLTDHSDWAVSEEHLEKLLTNSIKPLLEDGVFPSDITKQLKWDDVTETLMGPVAAAALETVANHQTAFLGDDFDPDKALGAITRAVFLKAAEDDTLKDQFKKQGLVELYRAALGVAAERPGLFLGDADTSAEKLANDLFARIFTVLKDESPFNQDGGLFTKEVGLKLAATAIEAIGSNAHNFTDPAKPWEQVAADTVKFLAQQMANSIKNNENLKSVLRQEHLIEIGRIVLTRIAETPGMVVDSDKEAWHGVISAVANAMKADEKLLLTGNDWKLIAVAAAEQAAINPGRLFDWEPSDPNKVLAGELMSTVLKASARLLQEQQLKKRAVLYGSTLREAMIIVIEHTSPSTDPALIDPVITDLHRLVAEHAERYGAKEFLLVLERILSGAKQGEQIPTINQANVDAILQAGA